MVISLWPPPSFFQNKLHISTSVTHLLHYGLEMEEKKNVGGVKGGDVSHGALCFGFLAVFCYGFHRTLHCVVDAGCRRGKLGAVTSRAMFCSVLCISPCWKGLFLLGLSFRKRCGGGIDCAFFIIFVERSSQFFNIELWNWFKFIVASQFSLT